MFPYIRIPSGSLERFACVVGVKGVQLHFAESERTEFRPWTARLRNETNHITETRSNRKSMMDDDAAAAQRGDRSSNLGRIGLIVIDQAVAVAPDPDP